MPYPSDGLLDVDDHAAEVPDLAGAPHRSETSYLFPAPPSVADVRQGGFADCFLLAPLIAILDSPGGRDHIVGMMRGQGGWLSKRTVTVRLYGKSGAPREIRMAGTLAADGALGAPWVQFL